MARREQRVPAEQMGFFSSLVYPDYRRLWGATACSQAALWALIVLRAALVYELTKSNAWVGFVTMAAHLPSLVVTPFAGFLADRCERRQLLALTYGLNLGSNLLLACLVVTGQVTAWHILSLAIFNGIVRAVESIGNSNGLFHRPRAPLPPSRGLPRLRSARPPCAAPPWRTHRPGAPWARRATGTLPCHASAPAAGPRRRPG